MAAAGDKHPLSFYGQIGQTPPWLAGILAFLVDHRSDGNGQFEIGAVVAGAVRSHAVLAACGGELGVESIVDERICVGAGDDED